MKRPVPRKRKNEKKTGKRKIFLKRERVCFRSRSDKFRPAHIASDEVGGAAKLGTPNAHISFCICSCIIGRPRDCQDHLWSMKLRLARKIRVETEYQWWSNNLRSKKEGKASRRWSTSSLKADCGILVQNWLARGNDTAKKREDHSPTSVLAWWKKNEGMQAEITDLGRRQSCAQALSATSERPFSEAGLIVSKKR